MAIKTIEDLKQTSHEAHWFASLGTFPDMSGFIPIRELSVRTEVDPSGNVINPGPIGEIEIPFSTTQGEEGNCSLFWGGNFVANITAY